MCGRYTLTKTSAKEFGVRFGVDDPQLSMPARFNIAPTQSAPVVRALADIEPETPVGPGAEAAPREIALLTWGFVPHWAEDPSFGRRMINARAESVAEKPIFKRAFSERRCLVIADGFYEWKRSGTKKQPYHIRRKDRESFAFAGIWETWSDKDEGVELESFAIITTTPNDLMAPIHNRMPVIIGEDEYERWLSPEEPHPEEFLSPYSSEEFEAVPVSTWVNSPTHDDPKALAEITEPENASV
jgi:putative SOS response-associated peptidase YedK